MAEIEDPSGLLSVLTSEHPTADRKAAARKLESMGRRVVVDKGNRKDLLTEDTLAYWQRGSMRAQFWGRNNNPVVSTLTLYETDEKVEVDPFELAYNRRFVALDSGYNSESAADWSKVTMQRRALLVDSILNSEMVANNDSVVIAEALSSEILTGKWHVLESRADNARLGQIAKHLEVPLVDVETPDSVGGRSILVAIFGSAPSERNFPLITPTPIGSRHKSKEFREFLMRGFNAGDIRGLDWDMKPMLVGGTSSLSEVAASFVEVAERYGKVHNAEFWIAIMQANPNRSYEARAIAAMYGITTL